MSGLIETSLPLFLNTSLSFFQPIQLWFVLKTTFCSLSLYNHDLKSGEALKLFGKILPLDPIKVSSPKFLQNCLRSS